MPTLVLNGRYDEAQDIVVKPFVDGNKEVRWHKFENSSHMPHFEEPEQFYRVVRDFLRRRGYPEHRSQVE